jgi:hypothetical protein
MAFRNHQSFSIHGEAVSGRLLLAFALSLMAILLASSSPLAAQSSASARSLGMAGSYLLESSNCDAAATNPANLALPGADRFSLKLVSLSGLVANNAFSLADYNKYSGAYLTESDKQDILAKIPGTGLDVDFHGSASALSFSAGSLAFTAEVIGGGKGTLPKDPIELALMGNKIGEVVTADGSGGKGWTAVAIGASYGTKLLATRGWEIDGGLTIKYLQGLAYYALEGLSAQAVTLTTGFTGSGGLTALQSLGGKGYAVDLGFTVQGEKAQYGLVFKNLLSSLKWSRELKKTVYTFQFDNVTLENSDEDSLWTSEDHQLPVFGIQTRPPLEIQMGASRRFGKLLTAASIKQGFEESAFVSKRPRVAAGIEYPLFGLLALRTGMAVGGVDDLSAGLGLGIGLGPLQLDLAYASASRLVPWGGNGGQFALSTIFEF